MGRQTHLVEAVQVRWSRLAPAQVAVSVSLAAFSAPLTATTYYVICSCTPDMSMAEGGLHSFSGSGQLFNETGEARLLAGVRELAYFVSGPR